jgi:PAS domain S-box-containing protein
MPGRGPHCLERLHTRWPVAVASAFGLYSLMLLIYAVASWQHMRDDADRYLVADSQRRAAALSDRINEMRDTTAGHADIHEIQAHLINVDLGMSMRYGLASGLAAIETRFHKLREADRARWGSMPRLAFISAAGETLTDTAPDEWPFPREALSAGRHSLTIDFPRNVMIIAAPVVHKGRFNGHVVTATPLAILYRNLLSPESASGYRELLIGHNGQLLHGTTQYNSLDDVLSRAILRLPADTVVPAGRVLDGEPGRWMKQEAHVVRSPIQNLPLSLVTIISDERAYGHVMGSRLSLVAAGIFPLILLAGAFRLDRLHLKAERLRADFLASERDRLRTEVRNIELTEEIRLRKEAETALAASQQRWELAIAGSNDGIWDWLPQTGEAFYSSRWKSMLGYADDEIGSHISEWADRVHPEDREHVMAEMRRHLKGETEFYRTEHRLRCKDGTYKWILDRGKGMTNEAGQTVRMTGSHSDITEHRLAQAALQDRNAQMDTLFSLCPDGFAAFGADACVKFANPAFYRMTGIAPEEILGRPQEVLDAALARRAERGERFAGVDGYFSDAAAPTALVLREPRHAVLQIVGMHSQAESVRRILYLRDITRESEVDHMKSEFLSTAAHELRTPMASIYGFAELLLATDLDEATRRDLLASIFGQTRLLVDIINELLDLARIEARRGKDFKIESVDLARLIEDTTAAMQFDPARWPLAIELPAGPLTVHADSGKLRQALANVLSNARKYSPEGGEVRITMRRESGPAPRIGLEVADSGIGMTPAQLSHLFERFWRADTSGAIPGTGLGMAIVKEIVELHGGSVEVQSQPGLGTSVTLWLPAGAAG